MANLPITVADHVLPDVSIGITEPRVCGRHRLQVPDAFEKRHEIESPVKGRPTKNQGVEYLAPGGLCDPIGLVKHEVVFGLRHLALAISLNSRFAALRMEEAVTE